MISLKLEKFIEILDLNKSVEFDVQYHKSDNHKNPVDVSMNLFFQMNKHVILHI